MKRRNNLIQKAVVAVAALFAATVFVVIAARRCRRNKQQPHPSSATVHDDEAERLPVVDTAGNVLYSTTRARCHDGSRLLHPVVHLHVRNLDGSLYLQRRPAWKDIQPGKWDTAVGGHVGWGECEEEALVREAAEELGLTCFRYRHMVDYVHENAAEREYVHVYHCTYSGEPVPSDELDGGRYWTDSEIRKALEEGQTTPNFASEYSRLFPLAIRRATEADIPVVRRLAEETFIPTYRAILTAEQLSYMMEWMYSADSLRQQMATGHVFYLATDKEGDCGYVSIERQGESLFHLQKLYVHPSRQGRGYGRLLITQAADYATALTDGPCRIELNVNRGNPALRFYEHIGMRRDRSLDTHIGSGYYMNDYIMALDLADSSLPVTHPLHYQCVR